MRTIGYFFTTRVVYWFRLFRQMKAFLKLMPLIFSQGYISSLYPQRVNLPTLRADCSYSIKYPHSKMEIITQSVLTCPVCGHIKEEEMPSDSCQFFYQCENCSTVLKPMQGDCCVYCSYGSVKCPSIQLKASCC